MNIIRRKKPIQIKYFILLYTYDILPRQLCPKDSQFFHYNGQL